MTNRITQHEPPQWHDTYQPQRSLRETNAFWAGVQQGARGACYKEFERGFSDGFWFGMFCAVGGAAWVALLIWGTRFIG